MPALSWTPATTPAGVSFADIAWSPTLSLFVAIQTTTGNDKFYSSPDGLVWTAHNYVSTVRPQHIRWAPSLGKFVAVGSNTSSQHCGAWTSADGLDWSSFTADIIPGTCTLTGLAWSDSIPRFVLIGGVFTGGIFRYHSFTSSDAVTWTDQGRVDPVTNPVVGKTIWAENAGVYFAALQAAGGTFGLASSADGVTWSLLGMSGITYPQNVGPIAYDPDIDRLVASYAFGGSGSIATSDDAGGSWTDQGVVSGSQLNIIWGNALFMMFGGSEIETSADGVTWTVDSTIPIIMNGGIYAPEISLYVAIGSTSTQAAAVANAFGTGLTPTVDAGPDKPASGPLPSTVTTEATVVPGTNAGALTYEWTQVGGPGLLVKPFTPDVANEGAAGGTTYEYRIVARGTSTDHSESSDAGATATGNVVLDGTNFNRLSGAGQVGVPGFDIYRVTGGATQGKIGSVTPTTVGELPWTFDDTGLVADGSTAPIAPTTAPTIVTPTTENTDLTFTEYVPATYTFRLTVTTADFVFTVFDDMHAIVPAAAPPLVSSGRVTLHWS